MTGPRTVPVSRNEKRGYWRHLLAGERPIGVNTNADPTTHSIEHYWRWPIRLHWRWRLGVSWHGVRDGVVRGRGPFHPAVRSFLWIGPLCLEFGWRRQAIENARWRRSLLHGENR